MRRRCSYPLRRQTEIACIGSLYPFYSGTGPWSIGPSGKQGSTYGLQPATVAALVIQEDTHAGRFPVELFWANTKGEAKVATSKTSLSVDAIMAIVCGCREEERE